MHVTTRLAHQEGQGRCFCMFKIQGGISGLAQTCVPSGKTDRRVPKCLQCPAATDVAMDPAALKARLQADQGNQRAKQRSPAELTRSKGSVKRLETQWVPTWWDASCSAMHWTLNA
ncbi:unnamed protein product [Durusdinium trenchii]|uniref:Uncharacterized protein n=1 Tax=Durusdinium trenchii TaxID=1381693 RepID=A0ABP0S0X2_9DINO